MPFREIERSMTASRRLLIVLAVLAAPALLIPILLKLRSTAGEIESPPDAAMPPTTQAQQDNKPLASTPLTQPAVDLLGMIDPSQDAVTGTWALDQGTLLTPAVPWGRLEIPCRPPEEYELRIVATRLLGTDSLNLGLASRGRQFMVVLDGNSGLQSGLDLIKGNGFGENSTTSTEKVFPPGSPMSITVRVSRGSISVWAGKRRVLEWVGNLETLELMSSWYVRSNGTLFIGAYATQFRIEEIKLTPVTGEARLLR